jgi:hypothetical protein
MVGWILLKACLKLLVFLTNLFWGQGRFNICAVQDRPISLLASKQGG